MKSVLKPVQKTSEKFVHFNPWRVTEPLMVKQLLLACIYYKITAMRKKKPLVYGTAGMTSPY